MILVDTTMVYTGSLHMRKSWCHLWTDGAIEELHQFALRLGLHRSWFQDKPGFPHYDVVPRYRRKAIGLGAQPVELRTWLREQAVAQELARLRQSPQKAISVREPWASAIIYGGKDIENRTWRTSLRGRIWIHAAKVFDREGWHYLRSRFDDATETLEDTILHLPGCDLSLSQVMQRCGCVIGSVDIVDCVKSSPSPWFFGPWGFVLQDPQSCEPVECRGMVGIFKPVMAEPSAEGASA